MAAPLFRSFAVVVLLLLAGASDAAAQSTTRITEEPVVSQPPPFSTKGTTVVVPRTRIEIDEGAKKRARPETASESEPDPACRGSRILCGDPLRRKQKKSAPPEE